MVGEQSMPKAAGETHVVRVRVNQVSVIAKT